MTIFKTLSDLQTGSVIKYINHIHAEDTTYIILRHFTDFYGNWTELLNMESMEKESFMSHKELKQNWWIVKEN
jgi:hypothetical protein